MLLLSVIAIYLALNLFVTKRVFERDIWRRRKKEIAVFLLFGSFIIVFAAFIVAKIEKRR